MLLYVLQTIYMDGLNRILVLFLLLECMDHFLINVLFKWFRRQKTNFIAESHRQRKIGLLVMNIFIAENTFCCSVGW